MVKSDLPLLTVFSDPADDAAKALNKLPAGDVPYGAPQLQLIETAPGAKGQPHVNIDNKIAAHFLSEDAPDDVTKRLLDLLKATA